LVVAVGADMARLRGTARDGYSRGFRQHLDRLTAALQLSEDRRESREQVTHLMSSLVGALLFARAINDPVESDAVLHTMRRRLRAEFCGRTTAQSAKQGSSPVAVKHRPSHDLLSAF